MTKQNLTENFAGKICPKTSTYTIGRIDIHKGLNTEGIKDHKDRPGLPQKTQGKEKPGEFFQTYKWISTVVILKFHRIGGSRLDYELWLRVSCPALVQY